jgi:hypothetical protein
LARRPIIFSDRFTIPYGVVIFSLSAKKESTMKRIDLTGQKFGKLKVLKYSHTEKPRGNPFFSCQCDCGKITLVAGGHLRSGHTQSCGCYHRELVKNASIGNTWGRKYNDPRDASARTIWQCTYADGCTLEKFLELSQLPCFYCGCPPSNSFNKYITKDGRLINEQVSQEWAEKATYQYNGLDRIDPNKGHDEDNVVPSCFRCNRAKDDTTLEEFSIWLTRTYNHFIKNGKAE